ncbi:MAG: gliding motility-associated protein GldE [Bacteroidetes bacterium]|nr:gliding motility-associated protein GldE [Bacteroidota bacterium]MBS1946008.1 gliding motility-associated protein GldE [Bacteroidota bacterium]
MGTFDPTAFTAWAGVVVLLLLSAMSSASEVALFSLTATHLRDLKERGGESGERVLELLAKPRRLLATILVTNNFANVGITVLSTILVARMVRLAALSPQWLFLVQVVAVTGIILLLGEVLPKVYATSHPMRVAQFFSMPVLVLRRFWAPVTKVLIGSTAFIEKRYRKRSANVDADTLGHALELTKDASTTAEEQRILKGIVKFGNIDARQVMRPRTEVNAFDKELSFQELLEAIINSGFSRVPVYEETIDRVVGVLYIKDVLPHIDAADFNWTALLRPALFVPENKKLDELLKEFQRKHVHLAVVVDEYGGTSGIITLEDVIEEIVGDITDEYDDVDLIYSKLDDRTYVFEGRAPLTDMYRILGIDGKLFEEHKGESETLGGFVLELTGRIPQKGERVSLQNFHFTVESADNKRVRRVKLHIDDAA